MNQINVIWEPFYDGKRCNKTMNNVKKFNESVCKFEKSKSRQKNKDREKL